QAQIVLHFTDTRNGFGEIFGATLRVTALDRAGQGHDAGRHLHFDVARIDVVRLGQPIAYVLANAVVGALIRTRAAAAVWPGSPTKLHAALVELPRGGRLVAALLAVGAPSLK